MINVTEDNWVESLTSLDQGPADASHLSFDPSHYPKQPWALSPFDEFFAFWSSARQGNNLPYKSDLKLEKIKTLIPQLSIFEHVDGKVIYRLRAAGLASKTGVDLEGHSISDMYTGKAQLRLFQEKENLKNTPCASFNLNMLEFDNDRRVPNEVLCLPLLNDEGEPAFAFALMHVRDQQAFKLAQLGTMIRWHMMGTSFCDIGFGAPEPLYYGEERQANFTRP